jgi:hypothetical protein
MDTLRPGATTVNVETLGRWQPRFGHLPGDPACLGVKLRYDTGGRNMEIWGLTLGVVLALWRYFFDIDWDLRVKRRRRHRSQGRP